MASNARETASMEDYLEWYWLGAYSKICFLGNEIPGGGSYSSKCGISNNNGTPQHWSRNDNQIAPIELQGEEVWGAYTELERGGCRNF
ncbi:hypothetical protein Pint_06879 [Pistacia integerrima]|uniref:Uncharacterized protein n=1 Tax=Pistacia integerrima TaxID=434235 RepID=A0ACC0XUC1_9ROSI|nr:hypothetical protein Pint_06879 [Pistacia integerrima]